MINKSNGNKVIPMIKLFKRINDNSPKTYRLSGYHIEALAIDAFRDNHNEYPKTVKNALQIFCEHSSNAVLNPITDNTGQSLHVDEYLGTGESSKRRYISHTLKTLSNEMNNADSVDKWKNIFKV